MTEPSREGKPGAPSLNPLRWLKWARVVFGTLFFVGLGLALGADGLVSEDIAHVLASSQFIPASWRATGGGLALLGLLGLLGLTVACGRIYCSAICPLGVLQDLVSRLGRLFRRKPGVLRYAPPLIKLRTGVLLITLAALAIGWGGFVLTLLDPYSIFGHLVVDLIRPAGRLLTRAIAHAFELKYTGIRRTEQVWAPASVLVLASLLPALVIGLSFHWGRLYCNALCPVGTLLGWISRVSAWRLLVNQGACTRCAECLRSCKAQCIDLRTRTVDATRCVSCYNCLGACDQGAISLRFAWKRPLAAESAASPAPALNQRRQFLRQAGLSVAAVAGTAVFGPKLLARADSSAGGNPRGDSAPAPIAIAPPGAQSHKRFLSRCTACQLCIAKCPTRVLKPAFLEYGLAGILKPRLEFDHTYCRYDCTACSSVCPEGALTPLTIEEKHVTRIGVAELIPDKCQICLLCVKRCPTDAITVQPKGGYYDKPVVDQDRCIGCGLCEVVCPPTALAIKVVGRRHQDRRNLSPA